MKAIPTLIAFFLFFVSTCLWLRMTLDEQLLSYEKEKAFVAEYDIAVNHCDGTTTQRCDGLMGDRHKPGLTPVRFTCDKDACGFDCK